MKIKIVSFLFYVVFLTIAAQGQADTLYNKLDSRGLKQGFWKRNMQENEVVYNYALENYKDGKLNGLCIYFYPNGRIQGERNYKDGILDGLSKMYRSYGTLYYEETYQMGKLNGWKKFYNADGELSEEQQYENGFRTGVYHQYSKMNVVVESYYINGLENGTRKVYTDNKKHQLISEFDFKNGVRVAGRFYKNDKLIREEKFDYDEELKKDQMLRKKYVD